LIQWTVAAPRDPLLFSAYNRLQTANNFVHVLQATKWDFYILCPTINSLNGKVRYTRISFFSHRRGFPPDTNIGWKQALFSRPTRVDKSLWHSDVGLSRWLTTTRRKISNIIWSIVLGPESVLKLLLKILLEHLD
jgi:hypothetical protein